MVSIFHSSSYKVMTIVSIIFPYFRIFSQEKFPEVTLQRTKKVKTCNSVQLSKVLERKHVENTILRYL